MMNRDNVVINIEAMLRGAEASVTDECCIYRVSLHMRRHNEDAYTPKSVSIGPFHHNLHPHLRNVETIKLKFCSAFLALTETMSDTLISYIRGVEPNVRRCYSDTLVEISHEELVTIIFLDSCFILHLFCSHYRSDDPDWSDGLLLLKPWLDHNIRLDLLLLENQLPFFVLDRLFNMSYNARFRTNIPFLKVAFHYFDHYNTSELNSHDINIRHFTDLLRTFYLQHPPESRPLRESKLLRHLPSATELSQAGVKFKVNKESKCLLDLRFSGRVLEIPPLKVEGGTEVLFRNMVALEQCHYPNESYITDYVFVLDFLVNTGKDVDLLVRKKVMENWLGDSDSVANMFNSLLKSVVHLNFNSNYFKLCKDLNAFHDNKWCNWMSTLRREYCSSPWKIAASSAGILLVLLTLVQSVCSVWQTIKQ